MRLGKVLSKLRVPSIFSAKNPTRLYKISVKGSEGIIIFTEHAKKDFIAMAFLRAGSMLKKRVSKEMLLKKWEVKDEKLLNIISDQIKPYINEVEIKSRKKHSHFIIYKHQLQGLLFEEIDSKTYKVDATVKIWVTA